MSGSEVEQILNRDALGKEFCCEGYLNLYSVLSDGITVEDASGTISEVDGLHCEEHESRLRDDLKFKMCPYCGERLTN